MSDTSPEREPVALPGLERWPDLVLTLIGALAGWFARHYTQGSK